MTFTLEGFLMVLGRLTGLFLSAPVFASRQMPVRVKIPLILVLAATMAYFVPVKYAVSLTTPGTFAGALAVEIFVGYTIGFVAYIVFGAIQLAGQVMDMQMGFGIVNVVDPQSGMQIPLMGNLNYLVSLLVYLSINGHHYLLQAVAQSYQVIPVLGAGINQSFMDLLVELTVNMFVIAVKISAPIVMAILVTDVAMGFVARTVPQMNVFIVGMPLKIFIGLAALLIMIPVYIWLSEMLFAQFFAYLDQIIAALGL
ncbi:MAG: flagellar biosynthetic protein FliR [Syntrophomonadaceae bacterium]